MKATGIVRRVDDLGRIVIPKEIRRTLRIREGDPLLKTLQRQNSTYGLRRDRRVGLEYLERKFVSFFLQIYML